MQISQFSGVTSMEMSLQPKNMKKDGKIPILWEKEALDLFH